MEDDLVEALAELLDFVSRAGAAKLWTGHYARTVEHEGGLLLARAADPNKDQSYMLAPLEPDLLERIEFPLGSGSKAATRAEAAAAGLTVAERRESQEACFLAGDDYRDPALFDAAYGTAMLACAALLALGGLVSWFTIPSGVQTPIDQTPVA